MPSGYEEDDKFNFYFLLKFFHLLTSHEGSIVHERSIVRLAALRQMFRPFNENSRKMFNLDRTKIYNASSLTPVC